MVSVSCSTPNICKSRWVLVAILTAALMTACAEVPITGRHSLHLVPEGELLTLSLQQYSDVLKKSKLSNDSQKVAEVRKVGNRIAKAAEAFLVETGNQAALKNYQWEFNLIEDDGERQRLGDARWQSGCLHGYSTLHPNRNRFSRRAGA